MIPVLLSVLLLLPLLAALVMPWFSNRGPAFFRIAMGFSLIELFLSSFLLQGDYASGSWVFVERYPWIPSLGIGYHVGVDGLSLWMVLLSTLLWPLALFLSARTMTELPKVYVSALFALQTCVLGSFVALDLVLFYAFWELMLVPVGILIGFWGRGARIAAMLRFVLYTLAGSLALLLAILYLGVQYNTLQGAPSFDFDDLRRLVLPYRAQLWLFAAFGLAFLIKIPVFPFHTWAPEAYASAPPALAMLLSAVLAKMGSYALLRFALPLFPLAAHYLGPTLVMLALLGMIFGAFCAWAQRDMKRLLAYSSMSHLGIIVLGILTASRGGIVGASFHMLSHGLAMALLFALVGLLEARSSSTSLDDFGDLAGATPWFALYFMLAVLAGVSLPGTNAFVGELMILAATLGARSLYPWPMLFTILALSGVVWGAVYMLRMAQKLLWGTRASSSTAIPSDLASSERWVLGPLVLVLFVLGFFPNLVLHSQAPAGSAWLRDYRKKLAVQAPKDEAVLWDPAAEPAADAADAPLAMRLRGMR